MEIWAYNLWGKDKPVFMIAEIGINHNADMQICKRLIDAAFATGWDCVKFQKRNPDVCVPKDQKGVMKRTPWGDMTYIQYRHKMEFQKNDYDYINLYCGWKPIYWTASAWDCDSVYFLKQYDIPFIKIPSAQLTNYRLLKVAAENNKIIMLSTGMSTLDEIDKAVEVLKENAREFILMHTNSAYPAPLNELNLTMIPKLKERYGCEVGYSGHEYGLEPTVMAVALGARVIERHITLDHNMWGSDQAASLEIHAMDMLRKRVQDVDLCIGDGIKRVTELEKKVKVKLRTGVQ